MKKNDNNLVGMYAGLLMSLLVVPFVGLAVANTSFDLGASKLQAVVEAQAGVYTSTIDLGIHQEALKTSTSKYARPETTQDIIKDYKAYLSNNQ